MNRELFELLQDNRELKLEVIEKILNESFWIMNEYTSDEINNYFMFESGIIPPQEPQTVGNYLYTSYRCPCCGKRLYKTVFPENIYLVVLWERNWNNIPISRVFVCLDCELLFAAMLTHKLSEGNIIELMISPDNKASKGIRECWIKLFNDEGDLYAKRNE